MKRIFAGIFAIALAVLAIAPGAAYADIVGLAEKQTTRNGLYQVTIRPEVEPAGLGPIHTWLVTLTDPKGQPVTGATIAVDGGMPAHGHGLPTAPAVTGEIEPGVYRVDGVKFSMIGAWELRFTIDAAAGADTIIASFSVK